MSRMFISWVVTPVWFLLLFTWPVVRFVGGVYILYQLALVVAGGSWWVFIGYFVAYTLLTAFVTSYKPPVMHDS